jgi:hypothetical protein
LQVEFPREEEMWWVCARLGPSMLRMGGGGVVAARASISGQPAGLSEPVSVSVFNGAATVAGAHTHTHTHTHTTVATATCVRCNPHSAVKVKCGRGRCAGSTNAPTSSRKPLEHRHHGSCVRPGPEHSGEGEDGARDRKTSKAVAGRGLPFRIVRRGRD